MWPPTGLALAAVLIWSPRVWPGIFIGAYAANITAAGGPLAVLGIAAGNTLEAVVGALLLSLVGFRGSLDRIRDVAALVGLAGALATMVSATVGVGCLWADGLIAGDELATTWRTWWLGDMGGVLLVAPALLVFAARPELHLRRGQLVELACLAVALTAAAILVFSEDSSLAYFMFPLLFWGALRFQQPGAVLAGLVVSGIAVWLTANGHGPFVGGSPDAELLRAQTFASVATITSLLAAAVMSERRDAEEAERRLAEAQELAHIGSWEWDIAADEVVWSEELYSIFGLDHETFEASYEGFLRHVHPDDRARVNGEIERAFARGSTFSFQHRVVRPDGSIRTVQAHGEVIRNANGEPVKMRGTGQDVSERASAEQRFRDLLESAPDAMVIADERGAIVFVNSQAEVLFGYGRNELLGEQVEKLIPQRFRDSHQEQRSRYAQTPGTRPMGAGLELYARRRDGSEFPVEVGLSPLQTEEGVLVSAAIRDVTERKRAEAALAEAQERFRRAFEDAGTGMALIAIGPDEGGRFLEVNEALCRISGYDRDQLLAMSFTSLVHPDDAGATAECLRELLAGEVRTLQSEERMINSSGGVVWTAMNTSLVRDGAGRPQYRLAQFQDITERKRFEGQLQHLADHDPLTGLFNRRRFGEELERELASARRYGTGGAVVMLDIDNFKYVNDTLGHAAGDELLTAVARLLGERVREVDVLARIGGDEFGLILPHTSEAEARLVAADLLERLREEARVGESATKRVTASAGIALMGGQGKEVTAQELLVEADIAMYDAKEAGRDRFQVFDPAAGRHERMETRLSWADRIREAIAESRFALHAQPIMPLHSDEECRHELLVRMVGDDGDLIPPGTFLYIAEDFDLVQEIDAWVVREAIGLLAREQRAGRRPCFEVNLSAKSIIEPEFLTMISHELATAGADPTGLVFEVTETSAIVNIDRAREFARGINELGCGFAIDDFGAGFDYLKIDGEFIAGLRSNKTNQLVVSSVVSIAKGLGKQTIAEYVGDEETVDLLRALGVDYAQGFHIGRPRPVEAIAPQMRQGIVA